MLPVLADTAIAAVLPSALLAVLPEPGGLQGRARESRQQQRNCGSWNRKSLRLQPATQEQQSRNQAISRTNPDSKAFALLHASVDDGEHVGEVTPPHTLAPKINSSSFWPSDTTILMELPAHSWLAAKPPAAAALTTIQLSRPTISHTPSTPRRLSLHLLLLLLLQSRTGNRQAQNLLSIGMKRIAPGCTAALATLRLTIADASQHARRRAGRSCFPLLCVQAPQASVTSAQQNEPAARCHISAECRWAATHTGDLCAPLAAHPLAHTPPPAPPRKKIAF